MDGMMKSLVFFILALSTAFAFDAEKDVFFHLYTRDNPDNYQLLFTGNETSLNISNFRLDKPLKIFGPGKGMNPTSAGSLDPKNTFLNHSDVNVIVIDWYAGSSGVEDDVIAAAGPSGTVTGKLIDWLSGYGVSFDNIHLLGISIGSHVVGYAGRTTKKGKVAYLSACDPPRNYWETADDHVQKGDAKYVEVIHTNTQYHAIRAPIGDVDFYPNWGIVQPGCGPIMTNLCSHMRSLELLLASIDNTFFKGEECLNYEEIVSQNCSNIGSLSLGGLNPKLNATGVFYVETGSKPPYYLHDSERRGHKFY